MEACPQNHHPEVHPMPYTAEISRSTPALILFLLDQSGSMNEPFALPGEPLIPKAQGVADAINRLISELVVSCTDGERVLDRFHLGVVTYAGDKASLPMGFQGLLALSEVAATPLRVETRTQEVYDGAGGTLRKETRFPIWFEPKADGGTPMCHALSVARGLIEPWVASNPNSFPPIVFNITDGEASDGDPLQGLRDLQGCRTQDGQALTFNLLLADGEGGGSAYPTSAGLLPEGPARSLVEGSSVLPDPMRRRAAARGDLRIPEGARGVVIQASITDLIRFLDIGSRPVNG
jgi:uncharacterized protein YegL